MLGHVPSICFGLVGCDGLDTRDEPEDDEGERAQANKRKPPAQGVIPGRRFHVNPWADYSAAASMTGAALLTLLSTWSSYCPKFWMNIETSFLA